MRQLKILFLMMILCGSLLYATQGRELFAAAEADSSLKGVDVSYQGKPLFKIYANLGIFTPVERSIIISGRLAELAKRRVLDAEHLLMTESGDEIVISYEQEMIMAISASDSQALGFDKEEIALAYFEIIKDDFLPRFTQLSLRQDIFLIAKTVILAILVILISGLLFGLLKRLMDWLKRLLGKLQKEFSLGIVIRGFRVLTAEQFEKTASFILGLINFILIVILSYFSIYFLLYVIPYTRSIALQLQAYIMKPIADVGNASLNYLPNLIFIIVVVFVSRYLLKFLRYFFDEVKKGNIHFKNFYADWADSTYQIFKFLILFFVVVIIFPYLPGSGSPAFQGISIFVGVLVSLGSSSAIANIIAGIILTYMRAYRIGDYVKIGDKEGVLIESTLLVLRVKTVKNEEISIPNAIALSGHIMDYSRYAREGDLILHTNVAMGYQVPSKQVEELLIKAALQSEGINIHKQPFVHIKELKDFYIVYELNAYTDKPNSMGKLYSNLHKSVLDVFAEAGIEMVLPSYNALRQGEESTIPPFEKEEGK